MKGLIIKDPWITKILDGEKTWEIRGSNTKIRGTIALIKSGTGKVYGTVDIVDCKQVTSLDMYQAIEKHKTLPADVLYKKMHAWVVENPVRYEQPVTYKHKQGCVIWVNL